jgi:drug/metabolite transporter (DMT)-like permease
MDMTFGTVIMIGAPVAWWIPMLLVAVIATGFAYAASITMSGMLGSRLASFVGLLEVVAAAVYSWVLLGESLGVAQILGGVLILAGIWFVQSEKAREEPVESLPALAGADDSRFQVAEQASSPASAV